MFLYIIWYVNFILFGIKTNMQIEWNGFIWSLSCSNSKSYFYASTLVCLFFLFLFFLASFLISHPYCAWDSKLRETNPNIYTYICVCRDRDNISAASSVEVAIAALTGQWRRLWEFGLGHDNKHNVITWQQCLYSM